MNVTFEIRATGPLFAKGHAILTRAVENTVQQLMELGEQRLDATLRPRPAGVYLSTAEAGRGKASTGHYRRSIHTLRRGMQATIDDGRVVYGPWLEGTSSRNQTTRFRGYASFRRATQYLEKRAPYTITQNLQRMLT